MKHLNLTLKLFLIIALALFILPFISKSVFAQESCYQPGLQDNCDGENTDPDACSSGFECIDPDEGGPLPPICIECTSEEPPPSCTGLLEDCVANDECCSNYCNPNGDVCTCSNVGVLCDPATGFGNNGDGPCCTGYCLENPVTGQFACSYPGRICQDQGGVCRNTCNEDEAPLDTNEGGPQSDCGTGESCCIYSSSEECRGIITNLPGTCEFLSCPEGTRMDGFNPPFSGPDFCGVGGACCVLASAYPTPVFHPAMRTYGDCDPGSIDTAVGCVPVAYYTQFIAFLYRFFIGIGSGLSFLLLIYSGFMITTSSGDPSKLKDGKDLLTAVISGLVLLIFSVFVLEFIGVRILNIPGF